MGDRAQVASGGFTLAELVVTLLVLGLAVALAGPVVGRTVETVRARAEVARFSATLRHAREQAIATRRAHAVIVDPAEHRLRVVAGEEVRASRALPADLRVEGQSPAGLGVRFEPNGVSTGGDFRLTSGAIRYHVTVDPLTGRVRVERE